VRQSADALLAAAQPKAPQLVDELDQELRDGAEAVRARIADLTDALRELAELHAQAAWTRGLVGASGQSVSPFQAARGSVLSETLGKVGTVGQAFDFELGRLAERRRDAEARAREQEEQSAQWSAERKRQAAAREEER
jgi:hypothetical protein